MYLTAHMGRFILGLVVLLGLTALSAPALAATYYVRTDGGTNVQCTGLANEPYPGRGNKQACAWSSPMEALPPTLPNYPHPARINGGDTLIIEAGSYKIGWAPGYQDRWADSCAAAYASSCALQEIPSGTAAKPTRILGVGWDTGCKAPPELWGTQGVNQVLDLDGSSHVVIACLDLTDHSNCTYEYRPDATYACDHKWVPYSKSAAADYGEWADKGIHAQDSSNITLQDLNIHGFADMGVQAGRISNWTVTRVKVAGNGNAGWNGDLGGNNHNSTNSGTLTFTDLTVAWNGCAEDYPTLGKYIHCYGQNEGGYGDGFSEAWTGGNFVFIRPRIYKNTQDGIDLLYANGTGTITVEHGYFARNAGNDLKTTGNATITGNVFIAYCSWFKDAGYLAGKDSCRADGGEYAAMNGSNQTVVLAYNTLTGNPDGLFGGDSSAAVASDTYIIANNIFIGQPSYIPRNNDAYAFFTWFADGRYPEKVVYTNNLVWHTRNTLCDGTGIICKDPLLANQTMQNFDPTPLRGSPALGTAVPLAAGVDTGMRMQPKRDIGAVQSTPRP